MRIQLNNQDCLEAMKKMKDNQFDLAIVDPPYGISINKQSQGKGGGVAKKIEYTKKDWDKSAPNKEYFNELIRITKNQIVWGGNYFPHLWQQGCKGFICWNKLNHHDNRADVEMAWSSFDKLAKYVEYMWDGNRYGIKGNVKGVGKPSIRIHPTEKPIYLYEWLLITTLKKAIRY